MRGQGARRSRSESVSSRPWAAVRAKRGQALVSLSPAEIIARVRHAADTHGIGVAWRRGEEIKELILRGRRPPPETDHKGLRAGLRCRLTPLPTGTRVDWSASWRLDRPGAPASLGWTVFGFGANLMADVFHLRQRWNQHKRERALLLDTLWEAIHDQVVTRDHPYRQT